MASLLKKYSFANGVLRVRQKEGWASVPLSEVVEVKRPHFSRADVKLQSGPRRILDLSQLSVEAFTAVIDALEQAVHANRVRFSKPAPS